MDRRKTRPPLDAAALVHHETIGQVALAGDTVVYTLRRVIDGTERTELWTVPFSGGEARPLVAGPGDASCPRIDPEAGRLAYLCTENDAPAQCFVIPLAGGAPTAVGHFARGAFDLAWSADGASIVVLAEDDTSARVIRAPGLAADASPTAIRLTCADWRADGETERGLRLHPRHLHRVPLDGAEPQRLTQGEWSAERPRVDAAGRVYFLADPDRGSGLSPNPQVYRVDGDMRRLTSFPGGVLRFHLSERAIKVLAVPVAGRPDAVPPRWYVATLAADGTVGAFRAMVGSAHLTVGLLGDETDLHDWHLELDDSPDVTTLSRRGSTMPVAIDTGTRLIEAPVVTGAVACDEGRCVAVLAFGAPMDDGAVAVPLDSRLAPDLYALEPGGPRRLTAHGDWLAEYAAVRYRHFHATGAAGDIFVHLIEPASDMPCRGTVVDIHGGPTGQWSVVPPIEALLLAAAGYRVAMPNIRGSLDRGSLWVAGLAGAWGRVDVEDILTVVRSLVADGLAEPGRIGVMGLSYGGFLTEYLIGVTDVFAAAVAENGVTNQVFAWSASADGPAYNVSAGLGDPLTAEGAAALWDASPLKNVSAIHTPLLMLQGEDDRTCPAADNEQLFVALKGLGREVEYVLYPDESHLLQGAARLDRRIDRHGRVVAWFDTHLAARG